MVEDGDGETACVSGGMHASQPRFASQFSSRHKGAERVAEQALPLGS